MSVLLARLRARMQTYSPTSPDELWHGVDDSRRRGSRKDTGTGCAVLPAFSSSTAQTTFDPMPSLLIEPVATTAQLGAKAQLSLSHRRLLQQNLPGAYPIRSPRPRAI